MTATRSVQAAASAWLTSMELLARALPGGMCEADGSGTSLLVTGAPLASVNCVVDVNAAPRPERIGALAKRAAEELSVPWSIQVRAEPGAELTAIAAELGRTATSLQPFMVKELDDRGPDHHRPAPGELVLRLLDGRESDAYVAALAAGFEAPAEIMQKMGCPELLDLPGVAAYLAEVDGAAVGTALAFRSDDCVGVFNISVAPEYRGRGYGTAVTAAAVAAERDRGARTAYLHSSPMGLPVYESLGFRTVEHWTHFTP